MTRGLTDTVRLVYPSPDTNEIAQWANTFDNGLLVGIQICCAFVLCENRMPTTKAARRAGWKHNRAMGALACPAHCEWDDRDIEAACRIAGR